MSIDYAALKAEILADPLSLGYPGPASKGSDQALADLLNLPRAGNTFAADREPVAVSVLFANIDATEFLTLSSLQLQQLQAVLAAGTIALSDPNTLAILDKIFQGSGQTLANLAALRKREGS